MPTSANSTPFLGEGACVSQTFFASYASTEVWLLAPAHFMRFTCAFVGRCPRFGKQGWQGSSAVSPFAHVCRRVRFTDGNCVCCVSSMGFIARCEEGPRPISDSCPEYCNSRKQVSRLSVSGAFGQGRVEMQVCRIVRSSSAHPVSSDGNANSLIPTPLVMPILLSRPRLVIRGPPRTPRAGGRPPKPIARRYFGNGFSGGGPPEGSSRCYMEGVGSGGRQPLHGDFGSSYFAPEAVVIFQ